MKGTENYQNEQQFEKTMELLTQSFPSASARCKDCKQKDAIHATVLCLSHGFSLAGKTVEMHGSITQIVCTNVDCNLVADIDEQVLKQLTGKQDIPCPKCKDPSMRCRIMLYDDKDGELLYPTINPVPQ